MYDEINIFIRFFFLYVCNQLTFFRSKTVFSLKIWFKLSLLSHFLSKFIEETFIRSQIITILRKRTDIKWKK